MRGPGRGRRTAPFAVLGLAVTITYLAAYRDALTVGEAATIVGIGAALVAVAVWAPWDRLPRQAQLVLPLGVVGMIMAMNSTAAF